MRPKVVEVLTETDGESSCIGCAQCGGLTYRGAHHGPVENVGLELHEQVIHNHAAIRAQDFERYARILLHGFQYFASLERGSLQHGSCEMALVRVSSKP